MAMNEIEANVLLERKIMPWSTILCFRANSN